jgi:prepilin-type N-terminal cleavage/methylation domain-containing protein
VSKRRRAGARGFTLVELMMAVAIVGLLSSVAVPQYQRAVLRARAAERDTVMESLARAVNDTVSQQQLVPNGGTWSAGDNPPGTPSSTKRRFDWTMEGWTQLPMVVAGDAYYSYSFRALDPSNDGKNVSLSVTAVGDLDGDGDQVTRTVTYAGVGYTFKQTGETVMHPDAF